MCWCAHTDSSVCWWEDATVVEACASEVCGNHTEPYWTLCWQTGRNTRWTRHTHIKSNLASMLVWPSCDTLVTREHIPVCFPNVGGVRSSHMRVKPVKRPFKIFAVYTFMVLMLGWHLFMCHALVIYRCVAPSNGCQQVRNAHWWKCVDRSYTDTHFPAVMCFSHLRHRMKTCNTMPCMGYSHSSQMSFHHFHRKTSIYKFHFCLIVPKFNTFECIVH